MTEREVLDLYKTDIQSFLCSVSETGYLSCRLWILPREMDDAAKTKMNTTWDQGL